MMETLAYKVTRAQPVLLERKVIQELKEIRVLEFRGIPVFLEQRETPVIKVILV